MARQPKTKALHKSNPAESRRIPLRLPLVPVRDLVVFPNMVLPLFVGRTLSIKAIEEAFSTHKMVMLAAQKVLETESPVAEDIYMYGTVGTILRMLRVPDGRVKILVQGVSKAKIISFLAIEPYYLVAVQPIDESPATTLSLAAEAEGFSTRLLILYRLP